MTRLFAAMHESAYGPKAKCQNSRYSDAMRWVTDMARKLLKRRK
jgi:hypothetical protein